MNLGSTSKRSLRVYLISPKTPDSFWSMQGTVEAVGAKSLMPSATLATLVSLTPPDVAVEYLYCDENVSEIDWSAECDLVALTGFTLHADRIGQISRAFRGRGVPVALGGAFATLDTELAEPLADHLFVGEGERTWPLFLREHAEGRARPRYEQSEPVDLTESPPPDWCHIEGRDYLYMTVQTSRGCPNRCDFCDAVRLVGRKHRTKPLDRVMAEIENAYRAGAETIFFSDDNFHVNPRYTKELLARVVAWNTSIPHPIQFACQTSLMITDDEELLRLMADARFAAIFLGLESLKEDCLKEVNKGQLYRADLGRRIRTMSSYGLLPFIGLIVGFDHDTPETFDEIRRFLDETGSPIASLSVLNAPEGTPLYRRMSEQGRIDDRFAGVWHFSTNIVPEAWTQKELLSKHHELFQLLYEPEQFEPRAIRWLEGVRYFTPLYTKKRRAWSNLIKILHILRHYLLRVPPPVRSQFFSILRKTWKIDPRLVRKAITIMTQYCHYYDFVNRGAFLQA